MYDAAQENGHFEGSDWWSILDSFKITSHFRRGTLFFDVYLDRCRNFVETSESREERLRRASCEN